MEVSEHPTSIIRNQTSSEAVIQCLKLSKVFKDFWLRDRVKAVDGIDLEVRRGEVFGLLGPNGSGKSTTIKIILGLLKPSSGRVAVFGKRPEDVATKKIIGYLPEESYLYKFLDARETLDYYGRLFHLPRHQRRMRIDQLLEYVGLEGVQRRPVGEYSKGMQRRIGLAQALINDPQLLILDEPTSGLDPIGTRQIKDLILRLSHPDGGKPGKTILLCSHLLSDVEDVCDRVAIMYGGKVRATGTVDELLTRQDQTTIYTPTLDVDTIETIERLLEQRGLAIEKIEQPRQRLEQLFLEIVQKAQAEGAATSGARNEGRIASFLVTPGTPGIPGSGAVAAATPESEAVINQLLNKPPAPVLASEVPAATDPLAVSQQSVPEPPADLSVVEQLVTQPPPPAEVLPMNPEVASAPISVVVPPEPVLPPPPPPAASIPEAVPVVVPPPTPKPQAVKKDGEQPSSAFAELAAMMADEEKNPPIKSDEGPLVERKPDEPGEKPDESFLKALMNVEPFDPSKDADGKKGSA